MIIKALGDIENVSKLPVAGAIILVLISMFLTFIAGLIPARVASKKDPVVALRTE
jgi:putative ABC transport system permease protein